MSLPILAKPWIVLTALASLAAVSSVGLWSWRRTRSARDFFIAGQRMGLWAVAMATMSAAFSGFVFLGGPGLTYRIGVPALFIVLPVGFTAGLLCWTLGVRLRLLAAVREVFTIPDAIDCRFGSRVTSLLATGAVLLGTLGYLGSQLLALAILIEALFGTRALLGVWSLPVAMAAGLGVVLFYSVLGGMVAGVYTDLLQGSLMLVAATAVFVQAVRVAGGAQAIARDIAGSEDFANFFDPFAGVPARTALGFFLVFGVGVLGQPHMLHKFYMLRDPRQLKWMPLILGGSQALCLLIWLGLGLAVPALVAQGAMPPLENPDDAAPVFLLQFAPQALAGLVVAGVLAAIMSTADSFLNIGSAVLSRDLPRLLNRPLRDQLRRGRWATAAVAVAGAALALAHGDLIALLGTFAFGTLAAALAPTLAVGLAWSRVTSTAAAASIATGLTVNLGLEALQRWGSSSLLGRCEWLVETLPSAVALAASLCVLLGLTWLGGGRSDGRGPAADILAIVEH